MSGAEAQLLLVAAGGAPYGVGRGLLVVRRGPIVPWAAAQGMDVTDRVDVLSCKDELASESLSEVVTMGQRADGHRFASGEPRGSFRAVEFDALYLDVIVDVHR